MPIATLLLSACSTLATSPDWVGGGMVVSVPIRAAEDEARQERDRKTRGPRTIAAKHLLVMHDQSEAKPEGVHRTREEAKKRAQEALLKIRGGASFEEVVREYTDEPGGAQRDGDLGVFDRKGMVPEFAAAAFQLKVGEVSEVVETKFGFHVIKRTE